MTFPTDDIALEHVQRTVPPWRDGSHRTECGRAAADVPVITRDDLIARVKRWGQTRTAMTTCVTCWKTAARYRTWEEDPVSVITRETSRAGADRVAFRHELIALATLAATHHTEFANLLTGLRDATHLADHRARRAR